MSLSLILTGSTITWRNNLPYQQRTGRIAQKEFNRIVPKFKIEVEDRETAIKALEDSVYGHSAPLLETMTIRKYCTYFRVANEVYEAYHRKRGFRGAYIQICRMFLKNCVMWYITSGRSTLM